MPPASPATPQPKDSIEVALLEWSGFIKGMEQNATLSLGGRDNLSQVLRNAYHEIVRLKNEKSN